MWRIVAKAYQLKQINPQELLYFNRGIKINNKMSKFYITLKIHKITLQNPKWKTRPVTSTCGSPLAIASVYLDWKLQPLTKFLPTYCKNWRELKREMTHLGKLSDRAKLFTADAVSMYTNIDTDHGLSIVEKWLLKLIDEKKNKP